MTRKPGTSPSVTSAGPSGNDDVAERDSARLGVVYGLSAYLMWGLVPIYFKAVAHVPPMEVLAHRVLWAAPFLLGLLAHRRGIRLAVQAMRVRRTAATLFGTTVLIATNWFVFIWAVGHDQVLQASLGYFINPLVNVLLGFVFLGERLRRLQTVSVGLAVVGVGYLTLRYGAFPSIALLLAGSFGFYGLLRKTARVDALAGLTAEVSLLLPAAIVFLTYQGLRGTSAFGLHAWGTDLLLVAAGLVTAIPLLCFTAAARRLRLATLGFLQYVAPTGHFLLAVLLYGEVFTRTHLIAFGCIWTALALYSVDAVRRRRRYRHSTGGDR